MLGFGLSLLIFILLIYFGSEISMTPLLGDLSIPLQLTNIINMEFSLLMNVFVSCFKCCWNFIALIEIKENCHELNCRNYYCYKVILLMWVSFRANAGKCLRWQFKLQLAAKLLHVRREWLKSLWVAAKLLCFYIFCWQMFCLLIYLFCVRTGLRF